MSEYIDKSTDANIDAKLLRQSWIRMMWLQASFNYERMQACGVLYAMLPALKRIHTNKEDLAQSMKLHNEFFNTHPWLVTFILGVVLAMEKGKQSRDAIRSFKVAAMGPLGGIGDAMCQLTLLPIGASIASSLALDNVFLAPVLFLFFYNVPRFLIYIPLLHFGYKLGLGALETLQKQSLAFSRGATILGLTVLGALVATFVRVELALGVNLGETTLMIQDSILDKILPNVLPVLVVWGSYKLIMRGVSPVKVMMVMIGGSIALHYPGIL